MPHKSGLVSKAISRSINLIPRRTTIMLALSLLGAILTSGPAPALATPTQEKIEQDIEAFQTFFRHRFMGLALETYRHGVNALPQYAKRRKNWELLMVFPPYEPDLQRARLEWRTPFPNGHSLDDCFSGKPGGHQYPYFDGVTIQTIVSDINHCLVSNDRSPLSPVGAKMARLVAAFRSRSNNEPVAVDFRAERIRAAYEKGKQLYWTKQGQLGFSCASCHVDNAGNRLRGEVLGAALGQTVGFPVYRTKWALSGQPWGTIHRRYAACMTQMGAVPFEPQSAEYIALEVYQAIMNTGIPLQVPSLRQ